MAPELLYWSRALPEQEGVSSRSLTPHAAPQSFLPAPGLCSIPDIETAIVSGSSLSTLAGKGVVEDNPSSCSTVPFTCRPLAVVFGWMFSERRHVAAYLKLYNERGWDVLACHPNLINL